MFYYEDENDLINDIETKTCYSWEEETRKKERNAKPIYKYAKHNMDDLDLWVANTNRDNW